MILIEFASRIESPMSGFSAWKRRGFSLRIRSEDDQASASQYTPAFEAKVVVAAVERRQDLGRVDDFSNAKTPIDRQSSIPVCSMCPGTYNLPP
jgi:hypothetical protein